MQLLREVVSIICISQNTTSMTSWATTQFISPCYSRISTYSIENKPDALGLRGVDQQTADHFPQDGHQMINR
jgi:hypothetical protein